MILWGLFNCVLLCIKFDKDILKEAKHEWIGVLLGPKIIHERLRVLTRLHKARMKKGLLGVSLPAVKDGLERLLLLVRQLRVGHWILACGADAALGRLAGLSIQTAERMHLWKGCLSFLIDITSNFL